MGRAGATVGCVRIATCPYVLYIRGGLWGWEKNIISPEFTYVHLDFSFTRTAAAVPVVEFRPGQPRTGYADGGRLLASSGLDLFDLLRKGGKGMRLGFLWDIWPGNSCWSPRWWWW